MRDLSWPDQIIFGLINASLLFVLAYWLVGFHAEFGTGFAEEDGPVEYGTAVFLLISALVLFWHGGRLLRAGRWASAGLVSLYGLAFVFGAGEEISWGQRILGIETPEFFRENNVQNEITIHNLAWGEDNIAHTIFGNMLSAVILLYLIVLPLLYPRVGWIAWLADRLMVPVPGLRHLVAALVASLVMVIVDLPRQWEVYELIFGLLTFSIFLSPVNAARFAGSAPAAK